MLIAARQKKNLDERISLLRDSITFIYQKIDQLQGKIADERARADAKQSIIDLSNANIVQYQGEIADLKKEVDSLNKQITKLKRKIRWLSILGLVGIGAALYVGTRL